MTKEQLLAAIAAPGLYVVARRELIAIETDADGVQHELKPASLRRDGVLAPDGWSDREDLIVVGPFGRLVPEPIDVVLHCPKCGKQHIDAPETDEQYNGRLFESSWWECGGDKPERWTNPVHRSHKCSHCNFIWRPADVPTNGVEAIKTKGKRDDEPLGRNCLADRFKERADLLNEVRENFTRDDDLPNGLLSRIDDAIGEQT